MRKFKLIKAYPNCNNLGLIVKKKKETEGYSWDNEGPYDSRLFVESTVENYPEFWEEVKECVVEWRVVKSQYIGGQLIGEKKEPNYLITAFRSIENVFESGVAKINPNGTFLSMIKLEDMLKGPNSVEDGCWEIHSVKNSKAEEFTIGDLVGIFGIKFKIERFYVMHNTVMVLFTDNNKCIINDIEFINKPIFTSADGKDIFEGDNYGLFSVYINGDWTQKRCTIPQAKMLTGWLHFHTKEARQEYIDNNKPKYSLADVSKAYTSPHESPLFIGLIANLKGLSK